MNAAACQQALDSVGSGVAASLANRRFTAILTAFAIALSVCLLLAVERVRTEAKASFASTISGNRALPRPAGQIQ